MKQIHLTTWQLLVSRSKHWSCILGFFVEACGQFVKWTHESFESWNWRSNLISAAHLNSHRWSFKASSSCFFCYRYVYLNCGRIPKKQRQKPRTWLSNLKEKTKKPQKNWRKKRESSTKNKKNQRVNTLCVKVTSMSCQVAIVPATFRHLHARARRDSPHNLHDCGTRQVLICETMVPPVIMGI